MSTVNIPWGAKVSPDFLDKVVWIVDDLDIGDNTADGVAKLMTCMAWESGRSFSPSKKNLAGSGATGLIQFMPETAIDLGTTTAKLAKMTAEQQLNYVWKYFEPFKGKLKTLGDLYMAILWPKGVGKPETYVLWNKQTKPTTYRQNAGLDKDRDGTITKLEATAKVAALMSEGLREGNVWTGELPDGQRDEEISAPRAEPKRSVGDILGGVGRDLAEIAAPTAVDVVAHEVLPDVVADAVTHAAPAVLDLDTPEATTRVTVEPKTTAAIVRNAVSGWQGNFAGIAAIAGALLLNPEFSAALGRFTTNLASGGGAWGAFIALIGAGLIAYRHRPGA